MIEFCPPTAGLREKRVRFESLVSVILIPTRLEFEVAGLRGDLWWGVADYNIFKSTAALELHAYASLKQVHIFTAITEMYQPCASLYEANSNESSVMHIN